MTKAGSKSETQQPSSEKTQINPQISAELNTRLDELTEVYDAAKLFVARIAMEYGARHFKKAWAEYNDTRKGKFQDADDAPVGANVVKLSSQSEPA